MNLPEKINTLDEALRIIYLERAKDLGDEIISTQMKLILDSQGPEMERSKYESLLDRLSSEAYAPSLGQLLSRAIVNSGLDNAIVALKTRLPLSVVEQLTNDSIYTNNVPIVFFKSLLSTLNISFSAAEKSIRKTFRMLQGQTLSKPGISSLSPAFRKGLYLNREAIPKNTYDTEGKELFENKEALDKYLFRLNELMS